uniref:Uncharacterized protein n=1 Tax=Glossina brevipalpis TaxID=37001 RepID=A0A1A9WU89_9MUSC
MITNAVLVLTIIAIELQKYFCFRFHFNQDHMIKTLLKEIQTLKKRKVLQHLLCFVDWLYCIGWLYFVGLAWGASSQHKSQWWLALANIGPCAPAKGVLTTSGVLAPSVCDVESALLLPSPLAEPNSGGLVVSRSSITKSIGILPFKHEIYR